jgi:folate-dependent phosphoribosylglycinamide formyltransferase PurN
VVRAVLQSPHAPDGEALDAVLARHAVDVVALAGYMRLIPDVVTRAYRGRMLNVHPALLPDFGGTGMYGARVHRAVLGARAPFSGPSVHFVDEVYDHGPVIAQWPVPVLDGDDEQTLAARVLRAEHLLYPRVVDALAGGEVRLDPEGRIQSERFTSPRLPVMDPMLDDVTLAIRLDAALGPALRR